MYILMLIVLYIILLNSTFHPSYLNLYKSLQLFFLLPLYFLIIFYCKNPTYKRLLLTQYFLQKTFSQSLFTFSQLVLSSRYIFSSFGQKVSLAFISVNSDSDFTCFKRFNHYYILLLNSLQTLENTELITGKFSLIVSLALYRLISVY